MTRAFSAFSLVAALAVAGYLFTARNSTPAASHRATQVVSAASASAAAVAFQQAAAGLEQHRAESGSYAGADLAGFGGVLLARGDTSSYCMQLGVDRYSFHETGPGGSPAPGPC